MQGDDLRRVSSLPPPRAASAPATEFRPHRVRIGRVGPHRHGEAAVVAQSPCSSPRCGDGASSRRRRRPDRARDRARCGFAARRASISASRAIDPLPAQRRDQHRPALRRLPLGEVARGARAPSASSRSILFQTSISALRRPARCRAGAARPRRRATAPRCPRATRRARAGSRRPRSPLRAWRGRPRPAWSADRR